MRAACCQRASTAMRYSARAQPNPPVVVPTSWKEMEPIDTPPHFHTGDVAALAKPAASKALIARDRAGVALLDL